MQNKKNGAPVGFMIQRCHKWRQKRKQYIDQARTVSDSVERERLLQLGEHYGRMISDEQGKIDSSRDVPAKNSQEIVENSNDEDDESDFPDFIANIK